MAAKVVYSEPSDSKGYTRYFLSEAIGQAQAGVRLTGPEMKYSEPRLDVNGEAHEKGDYSIILHGVRWFEAPNVVKALKFEDGSELKLK